jgi:hypothetical protein
LPDTPTGSLKTQAVGQIRSNNETVMAKNPSLRTAWIALRFIVFGVFGFIVMLSSFVALVDRLTSIQHERGYLIPLGLIAVCGLGEVMMLFGVGEWGRWGYLFVFLSIPVSLLLFCSSSFFRMLGKMLVSSFQHSHQSDLHHSASLLRTPKETAIVSTCLISRAEKWADRTSPINLRLRHGDGRDRIRPFRVRSCGIRAR